MGREIRRVPADWQHPKDRQRHYKPMLDKLFEEALEEWLEGYRLWQKGEHPSQRDYPDQSDCAYWEWDGAPPHPKYHRPEFDSEPTHYQIYETVSEGTPTSPVFETLSEMEDWLISEGYSEHAAAKFINSGYAPSMLFSPDKGASGIGIHSLDWVE